MTSSSVAPSPSGAGGAPVERADVIVVGAGPGGSATAAYLADHGLDVVLLEKSAFPRDKICGDGLTPARRRSSSPSASTRPAGSAPRACGSRAAATRCSSTGPSPTPSPATAWSAPAPSSTRPWPATRRAGAPGSTSARASPLRSATPRAASPASRPSALDDAGRATGETVTYRAPVVVASDGVSSRLATAVGRPKREDRVMGVAVRAYYTTPEARRLPREPPRAVEPRRRRQPHPHARLRLALPARGRPHQRRPRHPRHHLGLPEDRLQGRHASLGRGHRPRVAARARRVGRPDPRRRAADGLQPHAALRRRPAPRRRLRRHGQPVQRRGHRLRPRGRRASAPSSSPRRWHARATPRASGCSRHTPRS